LSSDPCHFFLLHPSYISCYSHGYHLTRSGDPSPALLYPLASYIVYGVHFNFSHAIALCVSDRPLLPTPSLCFFIFCSLPTGSLHPQAGHLIVLQLSGLSRSSPSEDAPTPSASRKGRSVPCSEGGALIIERYPIRYLLRLISHTQSRFFEIKTSEVRNGIALS
jgi:hypothetical protein